MTNFDLREARAVLERTPGQLTILLDGLAPAWFERDEGPGTWTVRTVLAHLVHGEQTDWLPRVERILRDGERVPFDPFVREAEIAGTPSELLALFRAERAASLARLDALALRPADLDRRGVHPKFGPVTLRELLSTWVVHDLGHVAQIARLMAKRYERDVGPWSAFLPVLTDRKSGPAS
ncbi:MAG: DinB family protein [Planctomycetes bacterium]|nr:DinB family protein [Planctomycetota bacterium]